MTRPRKLTNHFYLVKLIIPKPTSNELIGKLFESNQPGSKGKSKFSWIAESNGSRDLIFYCRMLDDNHQVTTRMIMMRRFKEVGFVNTKRMYERALAGHYAVPGYNFNTLEQVTAMVQACLETRSPLVVQYFPVPDEQLHLSTAVHVARGAVAMAGGKIDIALHLDHGQSVDQCKTCIDAGFSSVMIDGSTLPIADNIAMTRAVVEYAHDRDVTVEGELGAIAGGEGARKHVVEQFTRPGDVADFVKETGVDSLAVSVGTVHGAFKNLVKPGETLPPLRLDILAAIKQQLPSLPIVLHGASAVPKDHVAIVNAHGGSMQQAAGIPDDQLQQAIEINVCKVNIHSDSQIVMTGAIRAYLATHPLDFKPRTYLDAARKALVAYYIDKNRRVLRSEGKAVHP
jgi:fructose-bisphosphate aldolase class II